MKIKYQTSALTVPSMKGSRREGHRRLAKGTEPCLVWLIGEEGPAYVESSGYVTIAEDGRLTVTVPSTSRFNDIVNQESNLDKYEFVLSYMTGQMTPYFVAIDPHFMNLKRSATETKYTCHTITKNDESIETYIRDYQLRSTIDAAALRGK